MLIVVDGRHGTARLRRRRAGNQLLLRVNSLTVSANYVLGQCIQVSSLECEVRDRTRGASRMNDLRIERRDGNNSFGRGVISRHWSFNSHLSVDEPVSRATAVTPQPREMMSRVRNDACQRPRILAMFVIMWRCNAQGKVGCHVDEERSRGEHIGGVQDSRKRTRALRHSRYSSISIPCSEQHRFFVSHSCFHRILVASSHEV